MFRNIVRCLMFMLALLISSHVWAARFIATFPHVEKFDTPTSIDDLAYASGGCEIRWIDGVVKLTPGPTSNGYCGFRNILFAPMTTISVGEKIRWTPQLIESIDRSAKHVIINPTSESDSTIRASGDRGMTYIWHNGIGDMTLGACKSTECIYQGGEIRPIIGQSFYLKERRDQWVWVETVFNRDNHRVRVYVSTPDRTFENFLLAERELTPITPASFDSWSRIDLIGKFMDRAPIAVGPDKYFEIDELVIASAYTGAPAHFFAPPPPSVSYVVVRNHEDENGSRPLYADIAAYKRRGKDIGRVAYGTACEPAALATPNARGEAARYTVNACGTRGVAYCAPAQ